MIEALLQAERLLVHGQVDQAEQIYASAVENDPRNAIAVVGLARVALERGDDRLAYERARAALEIDPQNAAAIRLEARLGEVLAARDMTPDAPPDAGPAPGATTPPEPAVDERPSERAFLTRNPTMAEHQQMDERRLNEPRGHGAQRAPESARPRARRRGLLRRIFGR